MGRGGGFLHILEFKARPVSEVSSVRSRRFPRLVSKTGRELCMRAGLPLQPSLLFEHLFAHLVTTGQLLQVRKWVSDRPTSPDLPSAHLALLGSGAGG